MSDTTKEKALIRRQITRAMGLTITHLECRVGGVRHRWGRVQPLFRFEVGETRTFQCDNCLAIKHTCLAPKYGEILHRPVYSYPHGYQLEKPENGDRVMSPTAVRAAIEQRIDWDSLPEAIPINVEES